MIAYIYGRRIEISEEYPGYLSAVDPDRADCSVTGDYWDAHYETYGMYGPWPKRTSILEIISEIADAIREET